MDLPQILILFGWFVGLPGLAILQIRRARRKRVFEKRCPDCQYELTGTRVGTPCPECGTIPSISRSRPADPDRVRCRGCDHDLEGLEWNADCPECGLRSAAIPRFESKRPSYPTRALLGGILLAGWLGLTILMVSIGSFRSTDRLRNNAARMTTGRMTQQAAVQEASRQQRTEGVAEVTGTQSSGAAPD